MRTIFDQAFQGLFRVVFCVAFTAVAASGIFGQVKDAVVDFDGDGKTDFGIMRSAGVGSPYTWWVINSSNDAAWTYQIGTRPKDIPTPADYDGDGKDDIAVWRNTPDLGQVNAFYIVYSSTGAIDIIPFGQQGDVPVVEDYDGDGKDDLAVFRAPAVGSTGQAFWYYRGSLNNPNNDITYVPWGIRWEETQLSNVDEPYPGDFDGDGKADFRVQRLLDTTQANQNNPAIFYTMTAAGEYSIDYFGWKSDRILPGDYDGDNKTDIAVARGFNISGTTTTWFIKYTSGIPDEAISFGAGFGFAQGDYDGDGKTDLGYFMTQDAANVGFWYLASSANREARFFRFGQRPPVPLAAEIPIAGYNNR